MHEFQGLLGYLNFSTGRPDPRVQAQFFKAWQTWTSPGQDQAWLALAERLDQGLDELRAAGHTAFKDIQQARAVVELALRQLPLAYRRHHSDLLFHQSDAELFQPGFLMLALEAVLGQQVSWSESERILGGTLHQINDYVGHRPVAILESRPRGEPYDHEKLCPIPLYFHGVGVAPGRYAALVARAVELLRAAPGELRADACFEFNHLDVLAFDPRAYDHHHPADRRPNYRFGEWDPHHIDNRGFYRRLVVRQIVLDGLLDRVQTTTDIPHEELLDEAATVLAGTLLMASGISGAGPDTHDSSINLAALMPRIARSRDTFYNTRLAAATGSQSTRLQMEAKATRQPFGGVRQHINNYLTQQRAAQLQQRHLAIFVAELGYPEAARRHAARVPAASLRMLAEIQVHLTSTAKAIGNQDSDHQENDVTRLRAGADHLAEAEAVMHRAIACGAMADPWNILGFQGLFPLFTSREDSVHDHRIDELIHVVDRLLALHARLRGEAAAAGDQALGQRLETGMKRLAAWWDRFATTTVNDVRHVHGGEAAAAADHVAEALMRWRQRGEAAGDLAFWRKHLHNFRTAKSFALVVEELLGKSDYRAAMALLMNWLSQADKVSLEDGEHHFHGLALRWMLGMCERAGGDSLPAETVEELVRKFMDYLEANADELWQVPRLERVQGGEEIPNPRQHDDDEDALFGAAYEGVTYQDTTDDGNEGELLGFEPRQEFDLEEQSAMLERRLRFLSTVARLFHLGSRSFARGPDRAVSQGKREVIAGWLTRSRRNYQDLLALMDAINDWPIPAPSGSHESLVEFDRRNVIKQRLLTLVIGTCLETALCIGAMMGVIGDDAETGITPAKRPRWEPPLLQLEQALWLGNVDEARRVLPRFLENFQHEPLLFAPLAQGGQPRLVLRAAIAQTLLRALAANLPRIGLLRETYAVLRVAQTMEREQKLDGPRVTEFDRLYQIACQASVEAAVESIKADETLSEENRVSLLGQLIEPYLALWSEHSGTVRVSVLESVTGETDWLALCSFIRHYGRELFHARFMTLGNLRGILHRGVGPYLKYLEENADSENPLQLIGDLEAGKGIGRQQAEQRLQTVLQAVIENYEEYKDYNTTTPQSDYGENLHTLLDFLRLKAAYDRQAWLIKPLTLVHEVLVKHNSDAAGLWQKEVERLTAAPSQQFLKRLQELETQHGMRLRTVGDRVRERFVQPLALDRVCALIEPAYEQARGPNPMTSVLEQFEARLQPYLESPTGSGLDTPIWLRRLEGELHRVQMRQTAMANLAENLVQIPRVVVPLEGLREQLREWPKP